MNPTGDREILATSSVRGFCRALATPMSQVLCSKKPSMHSFHRLIQHSLTSITTYWLIGKWIPYPHLIDTTHLYISSPRLSAARISSLRSCTLALKSIDLWMNSTLQLLLQSRSFLYRNNPTWLDQMINDTVPLDPPYYRLQYPSPTHSSFGPLLTLKILVEPSLPIASRPTETS